eukprot:1179246-Prorocentrum_minimum.AAC.2
MERGKESSFAYPFKLVGAAGGDGAQQRLHAQVEGVGRGSVGGQLVRAAGGEGAQQRLCTEAEGGIIIRLLIEYAGIDSIKYAGQISWARLSLGCCLQNFPIATHMCTCCTAAPGAPPPTYSHPYPHTVNPRTHLLQRRVRRCPPRGEGARQRRLQLHPCRGVGCGGGAGGQAGVGAGHHRDGGGAGAVLVGGGHCER